MIYVPAFLSRFLVKRALLRRAISRASICAMLLLSFLVSAQTAHAQTNPLCNTFSFYSVQSPMPASAGTGYLYYSWELSDGTDSCSFGDLPITSSASWLTISTGYPSCQTRGTAPVYAYCSLPFTVSQNTGPGRTATISILYLANVQPKSLPVFQYGAPETLTVGTSGSGTVTSSPSGISCPGTCSTSIPDGTSVTLSAAPSTGYTFTGWSGACSGTGTCALTMNSAESVKATFSQILEQLTVNVSGNGTLTESGLSGSGTITGPISVLYFPPYGTTVTLTPTPSAGYRFTGWSGACTGTGTCTLSMYGAENVTATFSPNQEPLSVNVSGSGTVTGSGVSISGPGSGSYNLSYGTPVTLTATPTTGYQFAGWSGACSGTGTCVLTMNGAESVTATFSLIQETLSVSVSGSGTVTGAG